MAKLDAINKSKEIDSVYSYYSVIGKLRKYREGKELTGGRLPLVGENPTLRFLFPFQMQKSIKGLINSLDSNAINKMTF